MSWLFSSGASKSSADDRPLFGGSARQDESQTVRFLQDGLAQRESYREGDMVEYKSSTAGSWIPAKVVRAKADGSYDLDCKPDVPADRIRKAAGVSGTAMYSVGDAVEYFSASQGKWIPAKVLFVKPDGRYNLDCKPDVSAENIRRTSGPLGSQTPASAGSAAFAEGEQVEYFSLSQGKWIPAKVLLVKADGKYNLDCKPDVAAENIRKLPTGLGTQTLTSGGPAFSVGDSVEYFGASQQRWIPAKVLTVNANGSYDLDCKPAVPPEKIRRPQGASSSLGTGTVSSSVSEHKDGDKVEYFSATQGRWIPATVLSVNASGNYDLDCKPDVPGSKVRKPVLKSQPKLQVGDAVEYFGATRGMWIPTKVAKVNEDGTFDLDCKPRVLPENIRLPNSAPESDAGSADLDRGPMYNVGDSVEYFGASQGRWIAAKVISMTSKGTYNLDVKQDVPIDRLRSSSSRGSSTAPGDPGSPSRSRAAARSVLASSATLAAAPGFNEPMQLLRVVRRGVAGGYKLEVCPEAVAALEKMAQRHVVAASVCGTPQSGKTYLLNHLLDRPQQGLEVLQVGGSLWSSNRTEGVWLWAGCLDSDERSPLMLLLDCEGFGDSGASSLSDACHGASRDMQILAICALLSSAVVMNSKGGLSEEVFEQLKSASRFGDIVEERGSEADGRPALLWLLRDFADMPCDKEGKQMMPDAYLEQCLHGGQDLTKAGDVRHGLLKFFRHRSCDFLSSPCSGRPESASFSSLSSSFKAGMEKFRARLFNACLSRPKAVSGKPMGCLSFCALLKQLVTAVNDGRILSMRAAWETVQHTYCGALADELRVEASTLFQALAAGKALKGGAKLPLSDEALFTVMRDCRRTLKSQWEERAIGDEPVRRSYWKEFKASLAREETSVRTQNTRLADQQLMEGVGAWQEWLDTDDHAGVDEICSKIGAVLDKMPSASLSRASRVTVQAAARRLSATRSAVAAALERQGDLHRKAVAWGEKAAQQEGTARSELESKKAELEEAVSRADQREKEHTEAHQRVEAKEAELQAHRAQLQEKMEGLEAARLREQDLKARQRVLSETESSLRADVEQARADAARASAERLAEERCASNGAEASNTEQQRLRELLAEVQAAVDELTQQHVADRDTHQSHKLRIQQEHEQHAQDLRAKHDEERSVLRSKQEQTREEHQRLVEETRRQLEEERRTHAGAMDQDKGMLIEHSRNTGILEGKVLAGTEENKALRERLANLEEKVHSSELAKAKGAEELQAIQAALKQAQSEVEQAKAEAEEKLKAAAEGIAAEEVEVESLELAKAEAEAAGGEGQPKCCAVQ
eukprot:TRINITY_DN15211_c0_g5_i1.p1 TRINITY_DN15211_c0_g5~~TRINITY_DN15211_c0_g5_i1.p1  ORF type:complete len:1317 (+),score=357.26 TRINITY_DN15211_c0_g5_i1:128-4078(+)